MAWTTPIIHSVGDILTASDWNITSNDLSFLGSTAGSTVLTNEATSSTSYTDLATVGPSVTVTTGGNAIVMVTALGGSNTTSDVVFMSYTVSGATTISASDAIGVAYSSALGNSYIQASFVAARGGLNAGSNTFTAKYRANAGTATFANRNITVFPLP